LAQPISLFQRHVHRLLKIVALYAGGVLSRCFLRTLTLFLSDTDTFHKHTNLLTNYNCCVQFIADPYFSLRFKKCDDVINSTFPTSAFVRGEGCALESMSRNARDAGYFNCFIIAVGCTLQFSHHYTSFFHRVDSFSIVSQKLID
jgi:hypothetical protein